MKLRDLPILRHLEDVGPSDPVFDILVITGPVVLTTIAVFGRSHGTTALATAYILGFVGYLVWNATTTIT